MTTELQPLHGNQACALAAVAAGCRFFAGYPITPSSEIAEHMSHELPRVGGVFVQMEDEIGSLAACIGASFGGAKAMTATSGPGFSLMQENLGYAAMTETPCVIVNVMRGGPSTGMPTRPAQGDLMQARWGTHGDHPIIVLTPASVQEIYTETTRAFALSERFRVPVVVLYDQVVAQLLESIEVPPAEQSVAADRPWAAAGNGFQPYAETESLVPPMVRPGEGLRVHTTGLTHAPTGFPTQAPPVADRALKRLLEKIEKHRDVIDKSDAYRCEDAEIVIVACGITARAARRAVATLREEGVKAGLFRPLTMWPFPERAFRAATANARRVLVPELNAGQLILEVERLTAGRRPVAGLNRVDGEPLAPRQISDRVKELARHD
ncbi:MAG: 2-oxoacid:acceptor oxidoreductase subunit alpha [Gammaproteobacteria bacterium]|nr:2-oxoacid:acceptor oxidoreductase subunit alpha [Gammaproteobacteria bacterium]